MTLEIPSTSSFLMVMWNQDHSPSISFILIFGFLIVPVSSISMTITCVLSSKVLPIRSLRPMVLIQRLDELDVNRVGLEPLIQRTSAVKLVLDL